MARPNIILWTCHDAGCAFGPYGDGNSPTPRIDRLAAEGTTFTRSFCTSPLCSPSRGGIQTGLYPHVSGLIGLVNQGWALPEPERALSAMLSAGGYDSALCGLQHIVPPAEVHRLGHRLRPDCGARAARTVDAATPLLNGALREPFYLEINTFEAHRPWDDDDGSIDAASLRVPPYWPDCDEVRQDLSGLYRHVRVIDQQVGRLLDALDASGLSGRTLFVFTVDHGIPFPRCKSTLYDGGIRTALMMRQPGTVPAGARREAMVSNIDLCPTLLEHAELPAPSDCDGRGFRDHLLGATTAPHRQWIFAEKSWHDDYDPMRCVRTERWKYIRNLRPGPWLTLPADLCPARCATARVLANAYLSERPAEELYDLHEDPHELHNQAADAALETTLADLRSILDDWMEQTGDPFCEHGYVPAPARNLAASMLGRQWWPPAG